MRRIVVVASEPIGEKMAGPAVRALELAHALRSTHHVTLIAPDAPPHSEIRDISVLPLGTSNARGCLRRADVVVGQGFNLSLADLGAIRGHLVVDCYDPHLIELLEHYRTAAPDSWHFAKMQAQQRFLLQRGDFFVCANERQRAYWLGALASVGRLNLDTGPDPSFRELLDVVPFGLPENPPERTGPGLREAFESIGPDDPLVVWNGGVWNWLDPETAVKAMGVLAQSQPNARLVFLGVKHHRTEVPQARTAHQARQAAESLGLLDRNVFFYDGWVPYDERQNMLLDADVAICLHRDTAEATLSFRTRLLDCLWTSLPILCSEGDTFGDLVEREGIGRAAAPERAERVAAHLDEVLRPEAARTIRERMPAVAKRYRWSQTTLPLLGYCARANGRSPRASSRYVAELALTLTQASFRNGTWRRLPQYAGRALGLVGSR